MALVSKEERKTENVGSVKLVVDAPNAVSAILNHSKIGSKINSDALNNLFYDELNKRKPLDDDTAESAGFKQIKIEENTTGGHRSLLSGLSLN